MGGWLQSNWAERVRPTTRANQPRSNFQTNPPFGNRLIVEAPHSRAYPGPAMLAKIGAGRGLRDHATLGAGRRDTRVPIHELPPDPDALRIGRLLALIHPIPHLLLAIAASHPGRLLAFPGARRRLSLADKNF